MLETARARPTLSGPCDNPLEPMSRPPFPEAVIEVPGASIVDNGRSMSVL